ncbi:18515_t:CDS:1, partial [Racocetra persica]
TFHYNDKEINKYHQFIDKESFTKNKNIINQKFSSEQTLYIESSDLSIDYLNDITIEDDYKKKLIKSFNYYLKKDQINYKSLEIDDLKIPKYLNDPLCSEINSLQRRNLVDLFIHIQHFIKEFLNKNDLDHTLLKIMRTTAINLGICYVHQRNIIIGDETFGK